MATSPFFLKLIINSLLRLEHRVDLCKNLSDKTALSWASHYYILWLFCCSYTIYSVLRVTLTKGGLYSTYKSTYDSIFKRNFVNLCYSLLYLLLLYLTDRQICFNRLQNPYNLFIYTSASFPMICLINHLFLFCNLKSHYKLQLANTFYTTLMLIVFHVLLSFYIRQMPLFLY